MADEVTTVVGSTLTPLMAKSPSRELRLRVVALTLSAVPSEETSTLSL